MALRVGKYEIRRYNDLNLRAYEFKAPEVKGFRKEASEPKWMPMEAYFGSFENALSWLCDRLLMDGDGENAVTAKMLLREFHAVRDEILDAVGDAVGIAS